jgi:dCMP deaminase
MADEPERITTWHRYLMEMALLSARKSPDDSLGVGCVIVGPDHEVRTTGYNGLPRGIEYTPARRARPEKYVWVEHAERNAIYNAARVGTPLLGCTAYVACTDLVRGGCAPCADCCRALIQAGVTEIVEFYVEHPDSQGRPWAATLDASITMLRETGVKLTLIDRDSFEPVEWEP